MTFSAGSWVLDLFVSEWMEHSSSACASNMGQEIRSHFAALTSLAAFPGWFGRVSVGPLKRDEILIARKGGCREIE
ncbi:MAG: hypothetical protein M2R45_05209 [Verrucomicrobia subdivision 3 bacterium]|nr:hypothetical protein [Limisphaerales bacterium]MCS1413887.1 hypothetical protein [Limisphaerales bacterium]